MDETCEQLGSFKDNRGKTYRWTLDQEETVEVSGKRNKERGLEKSDNHGAYWRLKW